MPAGLNSLSKKLVPLFGGPDTPKETWADGVTVFENPFADVPVPRELLPATCRVFVEDGYVSRVVYGFHPVVSFTRIAPPEITEEPRGVDPG